MLTNTDRKELESVMPVVFNRMAKLKPKYNLTDDQAQDAYVSLVERWIKRKNKTACRPTTAAANAIGWSCIDVVRVKPEPVREYPLENDYGYDEKPYAEVTPDTLGVNNLEYTLLLQKAQGKTVREVAKALRRSSSWVHRELVRLKEVLV